MVYVPAEGGNPARYTPDFPMEYYAAPGMPHIPFMSMRVFLPDEARVGPRPFAGWPAVVFPPFGDFACCMPPLELAHGANDVLNTLFHLLEGGVSVIGTGIPGTNSAQYTPGGAYYGGGAGLPELQNITLHTPLRGLCTYDIPGHQVSLLTHHDDVGSSQDGGVSYPFQHYVTCYEALQLAVQYVQERAAAWGIDRRLIGYLGRSAGTVIGQHVLLGPDRADPEMQDFRRHTTRLQFGILFSQSCWLRAFELTHPGIKLFPDAGNPLGAVAPTMQQVPAGYALEASGIRLGTRDYSDQGPGITGAALRAANGRIPLFLVHGEGSVGTGSITPTEALEMTGSDAANNRVPLRSGYVQAPETHPSIMGPLLMQRLREIEVDGFHAANSRLVIPAAQVAQLQGHVTDWGDPIVSGLGVLTREDVDDENGMIGPYLAGQVQLQLARIRGELGIVEPEPSVTLSRRTLVRRALVEIVKSTSAVPETSVFQTHPRPFVEREGVLPAVVVGVGEMTSELAQQAPPVERRTYTVPVHVVVHDRGAWDETLDEIADKLERAVPPMSTLGDLVERCRLVRVSPASDDEGNRVSGVLTLEFEAMWDEERAAPTSDLHSLQKFYLDLAAKVGEELANAPTAAYPYQMP